MKYNKNLALYLGILVGIILILLSDDICDNPDTPKEKVKTEQGKDTLINLKK
jgi:hypothetical protein